MSDEKYLATENMSKVFMEIVKGLDIVLPFIFYERSPSQSSSSEDEFSVVK